MVNNSQSQVVRYAKISEKLKSDISTEFRSFTVTVQPAVNNTVIELAIPTVRLPPLQKFEAKSTVASTNPSIVKSSEKVNNDDLLQEALIRHYVFQTGGNLDTKLTPSKSTFTCHYCSEVFYLKTGLECHHNRETVKITLSCEYCEFDLTFLNRCLLLKHLLLIHKVIPNVNSLKNRISFEPLNPNSKAPDYRICQSVCSISTVTSATLGPDPLQKGQVVHHIVWTTPVESKPGESSTSIMRPINVNLTLSPVLCEIITRNEPDTSKLAESYSCNSLNSEKSQEFGYWCSGCERDFMCNETFFNHLKNNEQNFIETKGPSTTLYCDLDGVPSNSICSYQFHKNLFHEKCPPFLCPECGEHFNKWELLYKHARIKCCHFIKSVRYKCPTQCPVFTANLSELCEHFENNHFRLILQCSKCPNAFATEEWFLKHLNKEHGIRSGNGITDQCYLQSNKLIEHLTKKLMQCLICRVVFCNIKDYRAHLNSKVNDHCNPEFVFQCEICPEIFSIGKDLFLHNKKNHVKPESSDSSVPSESNTQTQAQEQKLSINRNIIKIVNITNLTNEKNDCHSQSRLSHRDKLPPVLATQVQSCKSRIIVSKLPFENIRTFNTTTDFKKDHIRAVRVKVRKQILRRCRYCSRRSTLNAIQNHENKCQQNSRANPGFCNACKTVFSTQDFVINHGNEHLADGLKVCIFCNNLILTAEQDWENHLRQEHVNLIKNYPCNCPSPSCSHTITDIGDALLHFKGHHGLNVERECKKCNNKFENGHILNLHNCVKQNQSQSKLVIAPLMKCEPLDVIKPFVCTICSLKEFHSSTGLRKHILVHHKDVDLKKVNIKSMNRDPVAVALKSRKQRSVTFHLNKTLKIIPQKRLRISSIDDHNVLKIEPESFRTLSVPSIILEPQVRESNVRLCDGTFRCLKCPDLPSFISEDAFFEHVKFEHVLKDKQINDDDDGGTQDYVHDNFWCPECGTKFIVKPTLIKHLIYAHEYIKNTEMYLNQIGYGVRPVKPLRENQCEVCRHQCEDSSEHEKHIRTHGMAFLRRQQRKSN